MTIAVAIGLHNFAEGLAIGVSARSGAIGLATVLIIGFGLHNATEGFGIVGPLGGIRPSWRWIIAAGLIGGGPTFLGTIVGYQVNSTPLELAFYAVAGGAIIYVIGEIWAATRRYGHRTLALNMLALGFILGRGDRSGRQLRRRLRPEGPVGFPSAMLDNRAYVNRAGETRRDRGAGLDGSAPVAGQERLERPGVQDSRRPWPSPGARSRPTASCSGGPPANARQCDRRSRRRRQRVAHMLAAEIEPRRQPVDLQRDALRPRRSNTRSRSSALSGRRLISRPVGWLRQRTAGWRSASCTRWSSRHAACAARRGRWPGPSRARRGHRREVRAARRAGCRIRSRAASGTAPAPVGRGDLLALTAHVIGAEPRHRPDRRGVVADGQVLVAAGAGGAPHLATLARPSDQVVWQCRSPRISPTSTSRGGVPRNGASRSSGGHQGTPRRRRPPPRSAPAGNRPSAST